MSGSVRLLWAIVFALTVPLGAAQRPTPRRIAPRTSTERVIVRDQSGTPIAAARVIVSGPIHRDTTTDANGAAELTEWQDGTYRLRFEREGFVTLERDVTIKNGQPSEIAVALNAAPASPPPPAPPPPPPPPRTPPVEPSGSPSFTSIPGFADRHFIGREPLKESILGCTASATVRMLQLREAVAEHAHSDLDELLYVVAGEGAVRMGGQSTPVVAGWLGVIPRGLPHAIERRGKNPLILLSTLSGAPCSTPSVESGTTERPK